MKFLKLFSLIFFVAVGLSLAGDLQVGEIGDIQALYEKYGISNICSYKNKGKVVFYAGPDSNGKMVGYANLNGSYVRFEEEKELRIGESRVYSGDGFTLDLKLVEVDCPPEGEIACNVSLSSGTMKLQGREVSKVLKVRGECGG